MAFRFAAGHPPYKSHARAEALIQAAVNWGRSANQHDDRASFEERNDAQHDQARFARGGAERDPWGAAGGDQGAWGAPQSAGGPAAGFNEGQGAGGGAGWNNTTSPGAGRAGNHRPSPRADFTAQDQGVTGSGRGAAPAGGNSGDGAAANTMTTPQDIISLWGNAPPQPDDAQEADRSFGDAAAEGAPDVGAQQSPPSQHADAAATAALLLQNMQVAADRQQRSEAQSTAPSAPAWSPAAAAAAEGAGGRLGWHPFFIILCYICLFLFYTH